MPPAPSFIDLVEACYRSDLDEAGWVGELAAVARPLIGAEIGAAAFTYRRLPEGRLATGEVAVTFAKHVDVSILRAFMDAMPTDFIGEWMERPTGFFADDPRFAAIKAQVPAIPADVLAIHGRDPSGQGTWVGAPLPRRGRMAGPRRALLTRIAAHAAAGQRVRRVLGGPTDAAEAVLSPDGQIRHAEGPARDAVARDALRAATVRLDRARSSQGRSEPERTIDGWPALVEARWSLLDRFESDGKRYVIAALNEPAAPAIESLTKRERQVVAFAALGHHDKLIAYDLGIAHSTVRVLIHRAAAKLGARTREELIARARQAAGPPEA